MGNTTFIGLVTAMTACIILAIHIKTLQERVYILESAIEQLQDYVIEDINKKLSDVQP